MIRDSFGHPIRVGDRVNPADDVWWGEVVEIDLKPEWVRVVWDKPAPAAFTDGWYSGEDLYVYS